MIVALIMKKFLRILVLGLLFSNLVQGESLLPKCEGNDEKISSFSFKHFRMVRKWTNCHGTTISPKGAKYVGEFYKGKFHGQGTFTGIDGRKYVGQYKNHKKHGKGIYTYANGDKYMGNGKKLNTTGKELTHMPAEINILGNGKMVYATGKEPSHMLMEELKMVYGKEINCLNQNNKYKTKKLLQLRHVSLYHNVLF